jgi:hypothetical protein
MTKTTLSRFKTRTLFEFKSMPFRPKTAVRPFAGIAKVLSAVLLALFLVIAAAEIRSYALPITTVYIKRPDTRYHRRHCIAVRQGKTAISLAKAQSLGFRPCPRCKPPTW